MAVSKSGLSADSGSDYLTILCTVPDSVSAERIAARIINAKLAACVNIVPGIESVYEWQGKIERSQELLLIIKTHANRYTELEQKLVELHPYDTPEVIALPIAHGLADYLSWIGKSTQS